MKILLVNCTFMDGSTGKIVADTAEYYRSQGHEVVIAYGHSSNKESVFCDSNVHQIRTVAEARLHVRLVYLGLTMLYGGMHLAYFRLRRLIKKEQPDIVHLHCINGYTVNIFRTLRFLGRSGIPTVVTHHGEFYYTGACGSSFDCLKFIDDQCRGCKSLRLATGTNLVGYAHRSWKRMKSSFDSFAYDKLIFTAVSPWVKERSLLSPIVNHYRCEVVRNGVNTNVFKYTPNNNLIRDKKSDIKGHILLHATGQFCPNDKEHLKGGWYVVELAKRMPSITFVVVATTTVIKTALPDNMYIWGKAKDQQELASLYSCADVTLVTSRRETFSMIVAESLCCGTPVIGFKAGGPESIAIPEYCEFVDYGDLINLELSIKRTILAKYDKNKLSAEASLIYDKEIMATSYLKIYKKLL